MPVKKKTINCSGIKKDGSMCTREKKVPGELKDNWFCWQHSIKDKNKEKAKGPGSKLPPAKLEQIIADLQIFTSINFIAKRNSVSWDTVKRIENDFKDDIEKYREEKKKEFADRAWESIQKALKIGDRKLEVALNNSNDIQSVIRVIVELAKKDKEIDFKEIRNLIKPLTYLTDFSLRDLSTFIGTLVDKHELVTGNPTERIENKSNLSDEERDKRIAELRKKLGDK